MLHADVFKKTMFLICMPLHPWRRGFSVPAPDCCHTLNAGFSVSVDTKIMCIELCGASMANHISKLYTGAYSSVIIYYSLHMDHHFIIHAWRPPFLYPYIILYSVFSVPSVLEFFRNKYYNFKINQCPQPSVLSFNR